MEILLVPLCAILCVAALAMVTAGKARAMSRADGDDDSHAPPRWRDRHWRPRRPVVFSVRRRRTATRSGIVIPRGADRR